MVLLAHVHEADRKTIAKKRRIGGHKEKEEDEESGMMGLAPHGKGSCTCQLEERLLKEL